MNVIHPPAPIQIPEGEKSIFLAGSIDMGGAEDWQARFIKGMEPLHGTILNPRRPDWDSSWEQTLENEKFVEQVNWEIDGLETAGLTAMYFAPNSQAPITLLELGLRARSGRIIVCCPEGYWRKGNVDIICTRFGLPQVPTFEDLLRECRRYFGGSA